LRGHEQDVLALAGSDVLVSVGDDRTMRAWDPTTGELLSTWGPFSHESDACAVDPARRWAALGTEDGLIRVVSLVGQTSVGVVQAHNSAVKALDISRAGRLLSAGYDGTVQVREPARSLDALVALAAPSGIWERSVCWGLHEGDVLAGTFDGTLLHWPAYSEQPELLGDDGLGNACFNDAAAASRTLATASDDGVVRLFERDADGALRFAASGVPNVRVLNNAVAIHPTVDAAFTGGQDHAVTRWARRGQTLVADARVDLRAGPINGLAVLPAGRLLVATYGGEVLELDENLHLARRHRHHSGPVKAVRVHPQGAVAASCSADGSVSVWRVASGSVVHRLPASERIVNDLAFAPTGDRLATVGRDFCLTVHDLRASAPLPRRFHLGRGSLKSVMFLGDDRLLVGDYWGGVTAVDLQSGTTTRHAVASNGVSALALVGGDPVAASYDGGLYCLTADGAVVDSIHLMSQRADDSAALSLLEGRPLREEHR
jgi:WD40 repeat protein